MSNRSDRDESSSGLGLLIVKELVNNLYRTIICESKADKGNTFWVKLSEFSLLNLSLPELFIPKYHSPFINATNL